MVKILLRLLAIGFWFHTLAFAITLVVVFFQPDFTIPYFIIFGICIFGTFLLGRLFWSKSAKQSQKSISNKPNYGVSEKGKSQSLVKVSTKVTHGIPPEVLLEMGKHYSDLQLSGDLRILQDSIDLMRSTKDIDTFFSRSELAHKKALTIEQAINAGIKVNSNFLSSKKIMELRNSLLPGVLNDAYIKMSVEAGRLKTTKGKLGRYNKFLKFLEDNEYELDLCDNYEEIVKIIKNEISNFEHQLAINAKS